MHYGWAILPTKPYTPRHEGKIESSVKYVKNNGLKGRSFTSLAEQNAFLDEWEESIADTRIHGTTKRQVQAQFAAERASLLPYRPTAFPVIARRCGPCIATGISIWTALFTASARSIRTPSRRRRNRSRKRKGAASRATPSTSGR